MAGEHVLDTDDDRELDEAIADYLEAVDAGRPPDTAAWLARHPHLAAQLTAFIAADERLADRADRGLPLPARVGDYELLEEVARGGMGVVYRARQVSLNRTVAVKMILAGRFASAADVRRFRREAEAAAAFDHPGIVPIYEVDEHDGRPFFAMKFIEGGNLAAHVARFTHDPPAAARLVAAVARSVQYAHERGVLHRDLKPANVLLDPDARPLLTDFGLAHRADADGRLTPTGAALGTPSYMAPEQAVGAPGSVTTAADVYSLGAILYELLTGRPPVRGATAVETLRLLLETEPPRPAVLAPRIGRDLETVCLKCLEKDPVRRYGSADELADDLDRYLRGEGVRARRVGAARWAWRWCARRPVLAGLGAALAASVVGGAAVGGWQWRRATLNADRAEAQRARAEEEFHRAHRAVALLSAKAGEAPQRDAPAVQAVRRDLLEAALPYYEEFLREREGDPALRAELADAHFRIAEITAVTGPRTKARESYGRALALYEELLRDDPGNVSHRSALAEVHTRFGVLHAAAGRPAEALASYETAFALYEQAAVVGPENPRHRNGLAAVCNNVGNHDRRSGKLADALVWLRRACDAQEDLVRHYPDTPSYKQNLATTHVNLGGVYAGLDRRADVLAHYRRAFDLRRELVRVEPGSLRFRRDAAAACRLIGGELSVDGKFDDAIASMTGVYEALEALSAANPAAVELRVELSSGYRQIGHAHRNAGRPAEARAQYEKALTAIRAAVRLDPESPGLRNDLAKCHFDLGTAFDRLGRHADAADAFRAAADVRRALVAADPGLLGLRSDLGLTVGNLAAMLHNLGRGDEAAAAARDAVAEHRAAFDGSREVLRHRRELSGALLRLANLERARGRFDDAAAAARERQALWAGDADELYAVAQDFAKTAAAAKRDWYAGLAVAALREAVAAGFRDRGKLWTDPAFEGLRGRDDFAALLR